MSARASSRARAVLFDKDGTLFHFRATWEAWSAALLRDLSAGDAETEHNLARSIGFDLATGRFQNDSLAIAGTNMQIAEALCGVLTDRAPADLQRQISETAQDAPLVPVTDLRALTARLRGTGHALGVMTNDSEAVAVAHLQRTGLRNSFDVVLGADSGHGAKPSPKPLLAFCARVGVDPSDTIMVGDSLHDLDAADAAGMTPVGVLTGLASAAELSTRAETVLNDISQLPDWLGLPPT